MSEVLDYFSAKDRATMAAMQMSGIARYLTNSPNDARQLTKQEVTDAHALGLAIHLFYEMNPTYPAYFTFAQGAEDARQAEARLAELGAPDGTVVYYTVDVNVDPSITAPYFNGVESATTPRSTPGGYGYQRFCEYARANFPNIGKHLWQTYGIKTVPLDGWQHLQENRAGVAVDVNDVTAPGWVSQEADVAFKDDPDAQAFVKDVRAFIDAADKRFALDAHHTHIYAAKQEAATIGGRTSEPLEPPVPGAAYFSSDDSLSMIGWTYPDGTNHFFLNGVEVKP